MQAPRYLSDPDPLTSSGELTSPEVYLPGSMQDIVHESHREPRLIIVWAP
jgi:hypothetical protein